MIKASAIFHSPLPGLPPVPFNQVINHWLVTNIDGKVVLSVSNSDCVKHGRSWREKRVLTLHMVDLVLSQAPPCGPLSPIRSAESEVSFAYNQVRLQKQSTTVWIYAVQRMHALCFVFIITCSAMIREVKSKVRLGDNGNSGLFPHL